MQFKPDETLIDMGKPTEAGMRRPPYVAVFERDGKKLFYLAETHSTVESFNMVNDCFKHKDLPDVFVVEYESSGRKLHDLDSDALVSRIKFYNILSAMQKLEPGKEFTISSDKSLNTLEYGVAMATSLGVPVVLADIGHDARQAALNDAFPGHKIDVRAAVAATPKTGCTNMVKAFELQVFNALQEIYPGYKFDRQKLLRVFNAGCGENCNVADISVQKLLRRNMVRAWNENFPDLPIDINGMNNILNSKWVQDFEFLKQNPNAYLQMTMLFRDTYMLNQIADALNKNDTVWCHFGEGHFRSQYKNLVKWMGMPKYYIDYANNRKNKVNLKQLEQEYDK